MMWMDLKCQTLFFAKTPETRQHFVYFFVRAPGFIGLANEWQAFFGNFLRRTTDGSGEAAAKVAQASKCAVSRLSKAAWRTISPAQPIRGCERRWNGRRGDSLARCQRSEIAPAAIGFGIVLRRSR